MFLKKKILFFCLWNMGKEYGKKNKGWMQLEMSKLQKYLNSTQYQYKGK